MNRKIRTIIDCPGIFGLFLFVLLALCIPGLYAGDSITPVKLIFEPTFENIGIIVLYTGDQNFNAKGTIQYRKAGTETWRTGHPLLRISDRPMLVTGEKAQNPRFATSLFYLEEGTEYEVKVVFDDPDGVTKQLDTERTATRNSKVPLGSGKHIYVDANAEAGGDGSKKKPFRTLADSLKQGGAGDTIRFKKGVYYLDKMLVTKISGSEKAWLHIVGEPGAIITDADPSVSGIGKVKWEKHKQDVKGRWIFKTDLQDVGRVVIRRKPGDPSTGYFLWKYHKGGSPYRTSGPHHGRNLEDMIADTTRLNTFGVFYQGTDGLYIMLPKGFDDPATADLQIKRDRPRKEIWLCGHHVVFEGFDLECTLSIKVYRPRSSEQAGHHVIFRRLNAYGAMKWGLWAGEYGLIEDSRFVFNSHWDWFTSPDASNGKNAWFKIKNGHNDTHMLSIGSHSVCRYNLIKGHSNAIAPARKSRNVDIYNNLITYTGDDGLEPEGPFINGRIYQNKLVEVYNCLSDAPIEIGPAFVFRNVFYNYYQGAIKIRNGAQGRALYYHNTCYPNLTSKMPYTGRFCYAPDAGLLWWMKTRNNIFIGKLRGYHMTLSRISKNHRKTLDYDYNAIWSLENKPLALFGEKHSVNVLPLFADLGKADMQLKKKDQPCVDGGEPIKGINDDVPEPYQFKGKAPDIGAYEYGQPIPHYGPRE